MKHCAKIVYSSYGPEAWRCLLVNGKKLILDSEEYESLKEVIREHNGWGPVDARERLQCLLLKIEPYKEGSLSPLRVALREVYGELFSILEGA